MLKQLNISHFILIEHAEVSFQEGFNVLSGETGSGKSAIIGSLNLIGGERADPQEIRRGSDKLSVVAVFDIRKLNKVSEILEAAGIDHTPEEDLIIKREVSSNGKSRAFVNNQPAQVSLLRSLKSELFELVNQHASQKLMSLDYHRQILDLYADLKGEVDDFAKSYEKENSLQAELEKLLSEEQKRLRDIEICRIELEEIKEAGLQEGEDEELFSEYTKLSNAEEIASITTLIQQLLSEDQNAVLPQLKKTKSSLEQLGKLDPDCKELHSIADSAYMELQEISHTLSRASSGIEFNPERLHEIDERLKLITKLKKKFGVTFQEIESYRKSLVDRLTLLEGATNRIEEIQIEIADLKAINDQKAFELTKKRGLAASRFIDDLLIHLRSLNMPKVDFNVEISPQKRSKTGNDKVEFYLIPNVGEMPVPVKDSASGGEMSRLLLSLQALTAKKEEIPTIIFDEIDANIGGETATVVGQKLKAIGEASQVLCITHFPQVAKQADTHLQIIKQEIDGRTVSMIKLLNEESKQQELKRMLGMITQEPLPV